MERPKKRICKICNIEKNIDEFRLSEIATLKDGSKSFYYMHTCKECERKLNNKKSFNKRIIQNPNIKIRRDIEKENISLKNDNKRICLRCHELKDLSDYYKRTDKDDYSNICKECVKKRSKELYYSNYEKSLEYRKHYRNTHKEERKDYLKSNKEQIAHKHTEYILNRRDIDRVFKLTTNIRNLLVKSLKFKGYKKNTRTEKILGCDIDFFCKYLLQTYKNNYGIEWDGIEKVHIDHIIPLKTAKTEEEVIKLCHYSNLQLLKEKDNLDKRAKTNWKLKK